MSPIDMAVYMKNRRATRRQKLIDLAGGKCKVCGSVKSLEFNHRDRSHKLLTLSGKDLDGSWEKILLELEKCDLLCTEHHRDYTREQFKNKEIRPWNDKTNIPHEHGTMRSYQETACRCEKCRTAKRLYRSKEISYDENIPL